MIQSQGVDIAVAGSSPAMLLAALKLAIDFGRHVTIFEADSVLGGAWKPQMQFGHLIDNGPHLL
jgi:ribulose 1,5-bisphosphate synthetase/thiazole synthase